MDGLNFGKNLKSLRKVNNLSMQELCNGINEKYGTNIVCKSLISQWENGIQLPRLEKALCIADYFDINIDDLVRG